MNRTAPIDRLAVCSWSLQPANARDLATKLRETGIGRVQLALDPLRENPAAWRDIGQLFYESGVSIVSGMVGCVGEDYSTLESIRITGGIAPDATWEENKTHFRSAAMCAAKMKLHLITFHAGFLPHDRTDPGFAKMLERLKFMAEIFAAENIKIGLETGQEEAAALAQLLTRLDCANVGVNFDPANMILYGKGDPVAALYVLGPWIRQVHVKDAIRAKEPGTWGEEVPVGTGEVDWQKFFTVLKSIRFAGNFVIEREAGVQRVADVRAARELFLKLNPS